MVFGVHTQTLTHRTVYLLYIVFIDCVCEHLRVQFYIECLWAAKLLPVLSVRCIIKLFLLALNVYSGQKKKFDLCEISVNHRFYMRVKFNLLKPIRKTQNTHTHAHTKRDFEKIYLIRTKKNNNTNHQTFMLWPTYVRTLLCELLTFISKEKVNPSGSIQMDCNFFLVLLFLLFWRNIFLSQ